MLCFTFKYFFAVLKDFARFIIYMYFQIVSLYTPFFCSQFLELANVVFHKHYRRVYQFV